MAPSSKVLRPNIPKGTLRRLVSRFGAAKGRAAGVLALFVLRTASDLAPPFLVAALIERLVGRGGTGGPLPPGYATGLGLLVAVIVLRAVVHYAAQVEAARLGQDLENGFRSRLFQHVLALRFTYHDENRAGATIARSLRDMERARLFFREAWFGWLEIGLLIVGVSVAVFAIHWTYGLALAATFGTGIAACVYGGRRIGWMDRDVSDDYDHVSTVLQENVAGAHVIRAFGREADESRKFGGRMDRFTGGWKQIERFWTGLMPWVNHLYHLCLPLALLIGVLRIRAGAGGIGEVSAVLLYSRLVHHRLRPLTRLVLLGQEALASAGRVFEVLDREEVIHPPAEPRRLPPRGGDVRFENVHFAYGAVPVLRGATLHVPAGSSLGLLGLTGAGKSTLVHLLPRFYDPDRGCVRLDGVDICDLDVDELRRTVGMVFQEPFLFSGTVAENVAYAAPGVDRETIERCVELAAADRFVRALPAGLGTIVGERGVSLSGGQRQRLTIARALALDPRVLVFDDATASVDAVTEKALFEGIREAARDRTTIVISQRVTSVRWCDKIAVLEDGRITHEGPHEALLAESTLYREIHGHQQLGGQQVGVGS